MRVVLAATVATVSTIFTVYALSYAVNTVGLARTAMLWVGVLANVVALVVHPPLRRAGRPHRAQARVHRRLDRAWP